MVMVASGDPGVPVICWADDEEVVRANAAHMAPAQWMTNILFIFLFSILLLLFAYNGQRV
jgi:hypothetical protein